MGLDRQSQDELRVFREFLKYCPIDIQDDSVIKQDPPSPDIGCLTISGRELEFELVEVVDQGAAKAKSDTLSLEAFLQAEARKCLGARREYRDTFIVIGIDRTTSTAQRKKTFGEILGLLCDIDPLQERDVEEVAKRFPEVIRRLEVLSDFPEGPHFQVTVPVTTRDPTIKRLEGKLSKMYQVDGELHLLAYFEQQPMNLGTEWWPDYEPQIRSLLIASAFSVVWFFDRVTSRFLKVA